MQTSLQGFTGVSVFFFVLFFLLLNFGAITDGTFFITSAKEVMFMPVFICVLVGWLVGLCVCLLAK